MSNWTNDRLKILAASWFKEVRAKDRDEESTDDHCDAVVLMNFTASQDVQWEFIKIAVEIATDECEFSALAAGPFEHLMGFHGGDYIDRVEQISKSSRDFRKMVLGSWRHAMSDDVWARVEVIKAIAEREA